MHMYSVCDEVKMIVLVLSNYGTSNESPLFIGWKSFTTHPLTGIGEGSGKSSNRPVFNLSE